jgi:hypothetical protein
MLKWRKDFARIAVAVLGDLGRSLRLSRSRRGAILVILLAALAAVLLVEWRRGDFSGLSFSLLLKGLLD